MALFKGTVVPDYRSDYYGRTTVVPVDDEIFNKMINLDRFCFARYSLEATL